jgi:hypothetical protein
MPAKEEERARAPLWEIADGGRSDKRRFSMTDVIMYKGRVGLGRLRGLGDSTDVVG